MDREASWQVIEQQRRAIADLLHDLTDEQWESPSACVGWRIRDVAAHVALTGQPPGPWTMLVEAVRAGGSFNRLNHDITVRYANRPGADLVAELREHAASRRLPIVTNYRNVLLDVMVHGQDIAIPLHHSITLPADAAVAGATRAWTMGWPFWAQRRLTGFRLSATDAEWTVGHGADVRGPIDALLLLLTGRSTVLPRLTGDGRPDLTARLTATTPTATNRGRRDPSCTPRSSSRGENTNTVDQ